MSESPVPTFTSVSLLTFLTSTIFDYAWTQLKKLAGGGGRGKSNARYWHRMIYGGLVSCAFLDYLKKLNFAINWYIRRQT